MTLPGQGTTNASLTKLKGYRAEKEMIKTKMNPEAGQKPKKFLVKQPALEISRCWKSGKWP